MRINKLIRGVLIIGLMLVTSAGFSGDLDEVDIAYDKKVLKNGLTVLVHEDRSAPSAFVIVYYKVGSRDEVEGKTGFAHLFEHLMFKGTENYDHDFFKAVTEVGGVGLNADTWFDRTRYYQTVPNTALDRILWLESERMGHFIGALNKEKLEVEIDVVKNEKRQGDNRPFSKSDYRVLKGLFPEGHPYSWDTIGSLDDLAAASLEDAKEWFRKYYGASNAIIAIGGDVDSEAVFERVQLYFGDIQGGPPVARVDDYVPIRNQITKEVMQDRAPHRQLQRHWVGPGLDYRESAALRYASMILGGDDTSRLYKALVKDSGLASSIRFRSLPLDLASLNQLTVNLTENASLEEVEAIIDTVMNRFLDKGPTKNEMEFTRIAMSSQIVTGLESVAGKTTRLAEGEFYNQDPAFYKTEFDWLESATAKEVTAAANKWFGENYHQMLVMPYSEPTVAETGADRSNIPEVNEFPVPTAPSVIDINLSNEVDVRFVEREGLPMVNIIAAFDFGRTAEFGEQIGVYEMTTEMLEKGAGKLDADEIVNNLKKTGSRLNVSGDYDQLRISLSTLRSQADPAIKLLSDIVTKPTFNANELALAKSQKLDHIKADKKDPRALITRYQRQLLFGAKHPYGMIEHGETSVINNLTREQLSDFHSKWFRPENLTLYVGGDIDKDRLKKILDKHFGSWKVAGTDTMPPKLNSASQLTPARVVLFDIPGAVQSNIVALQQLQPPHGANHESFDLAMNIIGGGFLSRINNNLRKDKGWTYGARSRIYKSLGPQALEISAKVQTDKTSESMVEILKEIDALDGSKPFTEDELETVRNKVVRSLPLSLNSTSSVLRYLIDANTYGLPVDDVEKQGVRYEQVTIDSMSKAFKSEVDGGSLLWIVSGDLEQIESKIRALNLGPVEIWSADGKQVQ